MMMRQPLLLLLSVVSLLLLQENSSNVCAFQAVTRSPLFCSPRTELSAYKAQYEDEGFDFGNDPSRGQPAQDQVPFLLKQLSRKWLLGPKRSRLIRGTSWPKEESHFSQLSSDAEEPPVNAVIIGGGPAGLLSAIMMDAKNRTQAVRVFEKAGPPPSLNDFLAWNGPHKRYVMTFGDRGVKALEKLNVWDTIKEHCNPVVARQDWVTDGPEFGKRRTYADIQYTIQRDKLVSVLHNYINATCTKVELNYNTECMILDHDDHIGRNVMLGTSPTITTNADAPSDEQEVRTASVKECEEAELTDGTKPELIFSTFTIGADGMFSDAATSIAREDGHYRKTGYNWWRRRTVRKFETVYLDDYDKKLSLSLTLEVSLDFDDDKRYSYTSTDGSVSFDALPADQYRNFDGILSFKDTSIFGSEGVTPERLREILDEKLPRITHLFDDSIVAAFASMPLKELPCFSYAAPWVHFGQRTVLVGDAAHTLKDENGMAANAAFEDVALLSELFDYGRSIEETTWSYTAWRAKDSEALVKLSYGSDRPGFFTRTLPKILDTVFHSYFPGVYSPNAAAMMQKAENRYLHIARRKFWERASQVSMVSVLVATMATAIIKTLARRSIVDKLAGLAIAAMGGVALVYSKGEDIANSIRSKLSNADPMYV
mmetsp:Transcript_28743/g.44144  ORF Transcript_28743/g.44144 Transcript_28743/m.44144 type:complete len:655 (+) Transcript_28743:56-2020(+)